MSKEIKVSRTFGNFVWTATVAIPSDDVLNALLDEGIARVIQSSPSGAVEKALAYPTATKRPEGFKRGDIPFSAEALAEFEKAFSKAQVEVGRNDKGEAILADLGVLDVAIEEYVPGEGAAPKFRDEKDLVKMYLAVAPTRTVAGFAEKRGIAVPTEPWDEDQDFLRAVKAYIAERKRLDAQQD